MKELKKDRFPKMRRTISMQLRKSSQRLWKLTISTTSKSKTEKLTEKFHTISAKMYQQAQAAGAGPDMGGAAGAAGADAGASQPNNDNVVDADYEVVDDDK